MKAQLLARLRAMDPRMVVILMLSIGLFAVVELWLLVLRTPLSEYLQLRRERATLERAAGVPAPSSEELAALEREIAQLGGGARVQDLPAADHMLPDLMQRLDRIATRHRVRLASVRPAAPKNVLMFQEVVVDIQISGGYQSLVGWLRDADELVAPLAVTQFSMKVTDTSGTIALELRLAASRPIEKG